MPFRMKFWQVQGTDLREIKGEEISDEQRLQDWLVKGASNDDETALVVVNPKALPAPADITKGQRKSTSPLSNSMAFQETKTRAENGDPAAQAALGFRNEMRMDA